MHNSTGRWMFFCCCFMNKRQALLILFCHFLTTSNAFSLLIFTPLAPYLSNIYVFKCFSVHEFIIFYGKLCHFFESIEAFGKICISLQRHWHYFPNLAVRNYYDHKLDTALWNSGNWAKRDWWADGQWIKSFIFSTEQLHTLDNRSQFSSAHKEVYQFLSACPAGVRRQITG